MGPARTGDALSGMAAFAMVDALRSLTDAIRDIGWRSLVDIALIAVLIYVPLMLLRGTTAMSLLRGGAILFASLYVLANILELTVLKWLLQNFSTSLLIAAVVIFQPEIRRTLERAGRAGVPALRSRPATDALIDAVATGCQELSRVRHGALIVLERDTGLEEYIATGRRIDAAPTAVMFAAIFFRNAPLHDGAVIVRGDRIVAAGCTLPLTDAALDGHVGTRHRAGIGITEHTDAVSVIVSEETGDISIACNGRLMPKLDDARVRALLAELLGVDAGGRGIRRVPAARPLPARAADEVIS